MHLQVQLGLRPLGGQRVQPVLGAPAQEHEGIDTRMLLRHHQGVPESRSFTDSQDDLGWFGVKRSVPHG